MKPLKALYIFWILLKVAIISYLLLAPAAAHAQMAQTNVLYGYVGNYGLSPQSRVSISLKLLSPLTRTVGNIVIQQEDQGTTSGTNGYFAFTNIIWGKYQYTLSGLAGTVFKCEVYTNTIGSVPIASLTTASTVAPTDPAQQYYNKAQVNALLTAIVSPTNSGVTLESGTNTFVDTDTNGLTRVNVPNGIFDPAGTARTLVSPYTNQVSLAALLAVAPGLATNANELVSFDVVTNYLVTTNMTQVSVTSGIDTGVWTLTSTNGSFTDMTGTHTYTSYWTGPNQPLIEGFDGDNGWDFFISRPNGWFSYYGYNGGTGTYYPPLGSDGWFQVFNEFGMQPPNPTISPVLVYTIVGYETNLVFSSEKFSLSALAASATTNFVVDYFLSSGAVTNNGGAVNVYLENTNATYHSRLIPTGDGFYLIPMGVGGVTNGASLTIGDALLSNNGLKSGFDWSPSILNVSLVYQESSGNSVTISIDTNGTITTYGDMGFHEKQTFNGGISGNGSGLTDIPASGLTGILPTNTLPPSVVTTNTPLTLSQLPTAVVTNGGSFTGTVNGNGAGLTNVVTAESVGAVGAVTNSYIWDITGTFTNSYRMSGSLYGFDSIVTFNQALSVSGSPVWSGTNVNGMGIYLAFNPTNQSVQDAFGPNVWLCSSNWPSGDINVSTLGIYFQGASGLPGPDMPNYDGDGFIYDLNGAGQTDGFHADALLPIIDTPAINAVTGNFGTVNTTNLNAQNITGAVTATGGNVVTLGMQTLPFLYPNTAILPPIIAAIGDSISTTNTGGLGYPGYYDTFTNINQIGHAFISPSNYIRFAQNGISIGVLNTNYSTYIVHTQHPAVGQAGYILVETFQNDLGMGSNIFRYNISNLLVRARADNYKTVVLVPWTNSWVNATGELNRQAAVFWETNSNPLIDYLVRSDWLFATNQNLLQVGPHPVPLGAAMLATNVNAIINPQMTSWIPLPGNLQTNGAPVLLPQLPSSVVTNGMAGITNPGTLTMGSVTLYGTSGNLYISNTAPLIPGDIYVGNVFAANGKNYFGSGSSLSNIPASGITGTLALSQLPSAVVTNGGTFTGTLAGNGAGLTNTVTESYLSADLVQVNMTSGLGYFGFGGTAYFGANYLQKQFDNPFTVTMLKGKFLPVASSWGAGTNVAYFLATNGVSTGNLIIFTGPFAASTPYYATNAIQFPFAAGTNTLSVICTNNFFTTAGNIYGYLLLGYHQ